MVTASFFPGSYILWGEIECTILRKIIDYICKRSRGSKVKYQVLRVQTKFLFNKCKGEQLGEQTKNKKTKEQEKICGKLWNKKKIATRYAKRCVKCKNQLVCQGVQIRIESCVEWTTKKVEGKWFAISHYYQFWGVNVRQIGGLVWNYRSVVLSCIPRLAVHKKRTENSIENVFVRFSVNILNGQ